MLLLEIRRQTGGRFAWSIASTGRGDSVVVDAAAAVASIADAGVWRFAASVLLVLVLGD